MAFSSSIPTVWEKIEQLKNAEQKRFLRWQLQAREAIHSLKDIKPGDHLVRKSCFVNMSYEHHFLCIGLDGNKPKIVHYFNKAWFANMQFIPYSLGFVQEMVLPSKDFIKGENELQAKGSEVQRVLWPEGLRRYTLEEAIERAVNKKGEKWYNCETFVMSCLCGLEISLQGSTLIKTTRQAAQQVLKSLVKTARPKEKEDLSYQGNLSAEWQNAELLEMHRTLTEEVRLREAKEKELRDRKIIVEGLQTSLAEERRARTAVEEELSQARTASNELRERLHNEQQTSRYYQRDLEGKEKIITEQRRRLKDDGQELEAMGERLRSLNLRIQEELNIPVPTERPMQLPEESLVQSRDWIIQREEVVLLEIVVGRGAWGIVREGRFRGCQIAVKELYEVILSDFNRRRFEREMSIASLCRHPNLLQFIGATNDQGNPLFVTELLDTSLRHILSQRALTQEETVNIALDIAKGLNYLQLNKPRPIMHRDISSANVLLWRRDTSWRAKLSDFGAANFMLQHVTEKPGAVIYAAPEAFTHRQTTKVDVYSYGVLLCEMCIREQPDPQEIHNQMGRVKGALGGLMRRCVKREAEERPGMSEVILELEGFA